MTSQEPRRPALRVSTRRVDGIEDPLAYAAPGDPTVWTRRGDILVGIGEAYSLPLRPGSSASEAAALWRELCGDAEVDDPVKIPGSGLIAFGALPFSPTSSRTPSLVVPARVIGRRGEISFVTDIVDADAAGHAGSPHAGEPIGYGAYWSATYGPGALTPGGYASAVETAVTRIGTGEVDKVVLARDIAGEVPAGADLRRLVRALATAYPDTWGFAVAGLIGASPETLVTVSERTVTARVLAGTAPRGADADEDTRISVALATSAKDLDEHRYAVQSVLRSLRPHTSALAAADAPFTLKLPNLWHLATDVDAELADGASSLDLVDALHPTAAVAGSPTDVALSIIAELEPFDRGFYAGPVGWIDASGAGEWAIALRCAQFDVTEAAEGPIPFTAHAGAGIVAGSDPETELFETRVKFRPIVDSLA